MVHFKGQSNSWALRAAWTELVNDYCPGQIQKLMLRLLCCHYLLVCHGQRLKLLANAEWEWEFQIHWEQPSWSVIAFLFLTPQLQIPIRVSGDVSLPLSKECSSYLFMRRLINEGEYPKTGRRPRWSNTDLSRPTRLRTQTFLIRPLSRLSPMSSSTLLLFLWNSTFSPQIPPKIDRTARLSWL